MHSVGLQAVEALLNSEIGPSPTSLTAGTGFAAVRHIAPARDRYMCTLMSVNEGNNVWKIVADRMSSNGRECEAACTVIS